MISRRTYFLRMVFNGERFHKVVIDPHYEHKHAGELDDGIILDLVRQLDGSALFPDTVNQNGVAYFARDIVRERKNYRLVWIVPADRGFLGVVNAYRRKLGKK